MMMVVWMHAVVVSLKVYDFFVCFFRDSRIHVLVHSDLVIPTHWLLSE